MRNLDRILPLSLCLGLVVGCIPAADEDEMTSGSTQNDPTNATASETDTPMTDGSTTAEPETDSTTGVDTDMAESSSSGSDSSSETGDPQPLSWTEAAGPCAGSGTNTIWFDDRDNGFIGCGENADGEGLYTSVDGGGTWEDNVRFEEVRIMDIRRGVDGELYGAGIHQLDGYPAWTFDLSGATIDSVGIYEPSGTVGNVTQAENTAVTADGQAMIDSLTGVSAAYRDAGGTWEEVDSLDEALLDDPATPGFQVRRILAHDNAFYGVGSLINDPARVHLPSQMEGATWHFASVELQPDTRDGELLDMHIWDSTHMILAGFDQSTRFPLIYLLDGGDPYSSDSWEQIELLDSGLEYEGAINDIHVVGDTVVAVGEKVPTTQGGFVVISEDGGRTWEDITPPGEPRTGALSAVWMFDNGEMVVAGGGGELWLLTE